MSDLIVGENAFLSGALRTTLQKFLKCALLPERATMNEGNVELSAVAGFLKKNSLVIDVGANIGTFSRRFVEICPDCTVLAFEPQSMARNIGAMVRLFKRRGRIITLPIALSDHAGLTELSIPLKRSGSVGIGLAHIGDDADLKSRFDVKKEIAPTFTLDAVLQHFDLGPVSFIKIDVEGGELNVLKGAIDTIRIHRPVILCEIDDRHHRFQHTQDDLIAFFRQLEFFPHRIETLERAGPDYLEKNVLFIHRSCFESDSGPAIAQDAFQGTSETISTGP